MTGAEALCRLESIGARILLLPDEKIDITAPRGPETEALIDELAAHKPEAVAVLRARPAPHLCLDCHAEAGADRMLCTDCEQARIERRKLVPFDPERRKRAVLRAYFSKCSSCGKSWWGFNSRGDAWCIPCWRDARKLRATSPQAARTATSPTPAIRPETTGQGGAA